ncbi:WD repeat-containing 89 homolog [Olea europaea subsp. europaea]|uniref:WD repeat-containing 89 homolog n=1 Tax=Olea europaea subsp. europaea TaxID=158383 RepID=A0A8S0U0G8_OLEEU|nr:WD repeat-containing 89 homolog [Olea europaea subsp. europaea]
MEICEEMEVEGGNSVPNSNTFNRFGLKNSIQTNFGDDYVFQIVPKDDWTAIAVSLSTNAVKLYSPQTGQYLGEFKGHSSVINEISFTGPSTSHILYSSSSDGTIRAWDTRSFQQVLSISAGPSQEVFSFSFGGADNNLLTAGCNSQIFFWDWRTKKQVAVLEESHMDDVTQVCFIPGHQNKLISASVDGLMCLFDTSGNINDDDHLVSVCRTIFHSFHLVYMSMLTKLSIINQAIVYSFCCLNMFHLYVFLGVMHCYIKKVFNVGTSIGKVGFLGEINQKLWCLTHIETLSVWDWNEARNVANFEGARTLASDSWTLDHVDYFVDCHYSAEEDRLWVIGGTNAGTFGYFPVNYRNTKAIGSPEAVFQGGHAGVVRSVVPMSSIAGRTMQSQSIFGWTGGEDGRLCCWSSDESTDMNRSWISSTLVSKSPKTRSKTRHRPY